MRKSLLIFPAGMPRALEYLAKSLHENRSVIGASSLAYDVSRDKYPDWTHLPFVTDPQFDAALKEAIERFNISEIFTPNAIVWNHLDKVLRASFPDVKLVNESPYDEVLNKYRHALQQARFILSNPIELASNTYQKHSVSEIELAALCRHADQIPGMCDEDKLYALCQIARQAVVGDIVEIGSWWGKSAFILARLARLYALGNLLCVDPWKDEHLIQNEEQVDQCSAQLDAEEALSIFKMNLLPYDNNTINFLRMTSSDAAERYKKSREVNTDEFGNTTYLGKISVLHIDGNHTFEAVQTDIKCWSDQVLPGGWIIVDDYIWPYGDGPKRVGDQFLSQNLARIELAFVQGSALFLQLSQ